MPPQAADRQCCSGQTCGSLCIPKSCGLLLISIVWVGDEFKLALLLAVLANIGRTLRTFGGGMALLVADAASTAENARLGALGLGVTGWISKDQKLDEATYPSSPQL